MDSENLQLTLHKPFVDTPEEELIWPVNSVVYHLYVRSFKDTNSDGIGDLRGVIEKISYLEHLGINTIWLSPIYPSPQADFGYDVADYKNIDPYFGTLEDFDKLIEEARFKGIKILMDFVPNHTSSKHSWFQESSKSKDNPKRDYYIWADPKIDGSPPNNWLSVFGGSAWEFDPQTNQYFLHTFDKHQPDLNWRNPEIVSEMLDVLRFWMDRGVEGFRVDVPYHMFKDPLLQDEPKNPNFIEGKDAPYDKLLHIYTTWLPEYVEMMKTFVNVLKSYGENEQSSSANKFIVTEAWSPLYDLVRMYKEIDWQYYQPFNFSLITLPWKAQAHQRYIDEYDQTLGSNYLPCYVLGNHDKSRVGARIGHLQTRVAAMLQLTLRGVPFIYYGEEIGMSDGKIPQDKIRDTFEINSPGLGLGRDPERTPMHWSDKIYADFSDIEPWLPVSETYKKENAQSQMNDESSIFSLYKKLIHLRKVNQTFVNGSYSSLTIEDEDIFAYTRKKEKEKILVVLNFSNETKQLSIGTSFGEVMCSTFMDTKEGEVVDLSKLTLRANEGFVVSVI